MPGTKSNNSYAPIPEPSVNGITSRPRRREKNGSHTRLNLLEKLRGANMLQRCLTFLGATFGLLVLSATPALATVFTANATTTCSTYSLALTASNLVPGAQYTISYSIDVAPGSNGLPVSGSIPFT